MAIRLERPARRSLSELAYETIAEAIYEHRLTPGERLSIESLCQQLDMSATPVREALSRAAALDLVRQDNHHGFTVAPALTPAELRKLFGVRRSLELEAVDELTVAPQAQRLSDIVSEMAEGEHGARFSEISRFSRLDHAFHREFVAAADNRFLLRAWEGLHFHLRVHRAYATEGIVDFSEAIGEHNKIAQAVLAGDLDAVRTRLQQHIDAATTRIMQLTAASGEGRNG